MTTAATGSRPRTDRPVRPGLLLGMAAALVALAACSSDSGVTAGTSASDATDAATTTVATSDPASSDVTVAPVATGADPTLPATTLPATTLPPTTSADTTVPVTSVPAPTTSVTDTTPATTTPATTTPATTTPAPATTTAPIVIGGVTLATCIASDLFGVTMSQPRPEVALYQYTLRNLGYDPGDIDGYFGPRTMEAAAYEIIDHTTDNAGLFIDDGVIYKDAFIRLGLAC